MKPILRWTSNGAAAVSAVLCVTVIALWVRSYWVHDGFAYGGQRTISIGELARGHLAVITLDDPPAS